MLSGLNGNIYKLYLIKIAKWFMLIMPIVVPFYNSNGMTQFDIMMLRAIYSVAIVVLEIPSGYFADVLGRKNTLIIGSILGFAGYLTYSFSHGFAMFLVAEIILGIGQSLISGADSAMLYDTLAEQKRSKQYLKYEGRVISIGSFAEAIAGIAGGLLATYSLRTPYYFQTGVAFIAIPAALTLIEPVRKKALEKLKFSDILKIFHHVIIVDKPLRLNIIFSSVIGASTLTMAWFVQPYFQALNLPVVWFGVLWTLLNLSVGITSMFAYKVDERLGQVKTVSLIFGLIAVSYIAVGIFQSYWAISFLFLFYLTRGIATPVLKDYINKMTDSSVRATVLSVRNFIIRLIFAGFGPLLGYLNDEFSLSLALNFAGILIFVAGLISLIFYVGIIKQQKVNF